MGRLFKASGLALTQGGSVSPELAQGGDSNDTESFIGF